MNIKSQALKILAITALFITLWGLYQQYLLSDNDDYSFKVNTTTDQISFENQNIVFESFIIPQHENTPAAHSSSFTNLPNGDIIAFWFAGTKEGNPDVKIWSSIFHNHRWESPRPIVDSKMVSTSNHRYVVKIGNPVVYRAENGILHLFVVSVSVGGWSGSTLNHLQSYDDGKTWSNPERIINTPFFNISTLVRTSAISLSDGGFYLPVYHELMRKYPEILLFDKNGKFVRQIRISSHNHLLQPTILTINSKKAYAYFRNGSATPQAIVASVTNDAGVTWSEFGKTNLTNQDSSITVANLNDGRYLMVYNQAGRTQLDLAISTDGITWKSFYKIENTPDKEFSYPALHVYNDDIHLMYTDNRKHIKHVLFNREWINQVSKNVN